MEILFPPSSAFAHDLSGSARSTHALGENASQSPVAGEEDETESESLEHLHDHLHRRVLAEGHWDLQQPRAVSTVTTNAHRTVNAPHPSTAPGKSRPAHHCLPDLQRLRVALLPLPVRPSTCRLPLAKTPSRRRKPVAVAAAAPFRPPSPRPLQPSQPPKQVRAAKGFADRAELPTWTIRRTETACRFAVESARKSNRAC